MAGWSSDSDSASGSDCDCDGREGWVLVPRREEEAPAEVDAASELPGRWGLNGFVVGARSGGIVTIVALLLW